jgi:ATP-dependent DNA helicase RecG
VSIFENRLEVASPGRLPNTATIDALKSGFRYARNQTLINVIRNYRYVDFRGTGIRDKIIPGMRMHNRKDPMFAKTEYSFVLTLLRKRGVLGASIALPRQRGQKG